MLVSLLLRQGVTSCVLLIPGTSTLGLHSGSGGENSQKQSEHQPGLGDLSSSRGSSLQKWELDLLFVAPRQTKCWWWTNGTIPLNIHIISICILGRSQKPSPFVLLHLLAWFSSDRKESACNAGDQGSSSRLGRSIPYRRAWQPTPVFLPGESQGQRSLAGYGVTKSWTRLSD